MISRKISDNPKGDKLRNTCLKSIDVFVVINADKIQHTFIDKNVTSWMTGCPSWCNLRNKYCF